MDHDSSPYDFSQQFTSQKQWKSIGDHPQHLMIGDSEKWVTWSNFRNIYNNLAFVSQVEPKNVQEALVNDY